MAVVLSAIPKALQRPSGDLLTVDLLKASNQFRTQLIRAGLGDQPIIAGWDVSFNENSSKRWAPYWQVHLYAVFLRCDDPDLIKELLDRYFPGDITIPRPLVATKLRDPVEQMSYVIKSVFVRRVSYIGNNGRQETRKVPLKAEQQRELARFLDENPPAKRLFLRHVRRRGQRLVIEP